MPWVKVKSKYSIMIFRADSGGEFILFKFWTFCKKRGISIKYMAPYIHTENGLAKQE